MLSHLLLIQTQIIVGATTPSLAQEAASVESPVPPDRVAIQGARARDRLQYGGTAVAKFAIAFVGDGVTRLLHCQSAEESPRRTDVDGGQKLRAALHSSS